MSDKTEFIPPRHIKINDYIYIFKDELINNFYSFRCKYRTFCKIILKISREELEKYSKSEDYIIKYEITSNQKEHSCNKNKANINNNQNYINEEDKRNYYKKIKI